MMSERLRVVIAALVLVLSARVVAAAEATIDVEVNKPGVTIPPSFYGLMTEEINHSYDGGLYAELIQNRTFQDAKTPEHWSAVGNAKIKMVTANPVNAALPISLELNLSGDEGGVANDGFWGIPVRPDTTYQASFYAKANGGLNAPVLAAIVLDDGNTVVAKAETTPITNAWKKYSFTLRTNHDAPTTAKARFVLSASGPGSICFSLVSLFPPTYQDAPNGLRPDLMKLMADLHPAFIRLPGGNYLEGNTFPTRFNWKKMIGPVDQRSGHMGCWSYRSSDGFGMPEFLLWCKQLNAEPVLALFAGYTLNHDHVNAGPELKQYVDEALEEIEYVTGDASTQWGKQRAADGFPEPFKLRYVEVGNEDWFDRSGSYDGRFAQFFDAIRAKFPDLKIIATTPVKSRKPDLVDDHYYRSAKVMANDWRHYDKTDRSGPKIFVGEWATQEGKPTPDLRAGLADAVWLMGLERDADQVPLECYAPLLVNVNPKAWQWGTNLIGYDALNSFGSPSYYAQCMFGQNKGDRVLPANLKLVEASAVASVPTHGAIGLGSWHTQVEYKDIVVTAPDGHELLKPDLSGDANAWKTSGGNWDVQDRMLKPSADGETWAITGDTAWTDYTLKLKARKMGGAEGFLILWHAVDGENYHWWNIGGWGNARTQCEAGQDNQRTPYGPLSRFTVKADQWYDLRLEVHGDHVRGYIDDKLVTDATDDSGSLGAAVFASASYITSGHEVILKVVNLGADPVEATINLNGAGEVQPTGNATVLMGELKDVNTVDNSVKVAPKPEELTNIAASFRRTFVPCSLTLIRVNATPR